MSRYSNYDFSKIKQLIIKLENMSEEEKKRILNEPTLKDEIIDDFKEGINNFYEYFRLLISEIGVDKFLEYYDFSRIHKFFSEGLEKEEYKLLVCLIENNNINKVLRYALKDPALFNQIFEHQSQMYSIFANIEYDILISIIKKIEESNLKYESKFLITVEKESKIRLLNEELKEETIWWMIPNFGKDVMEYFLLNDKRALTAIEKNKISILRIIDMEIKIPFDILYTNIFFDNLKSTSLVEFRSRINNLLKINPSIAIEEKVDKYYSKMVESYNPKTGLFKEFEELTLDNLKEVIDSSLNKYLLSYIIIHDSYTIRSESKEEKEKKFKQYLKKETSKKLSEIIVDALFKDNYYNVILNIQEMLRYQKRNKGTLIIDDYYMNLYELIFNIDKLSNSEKIDIYNKLKNKNINTKFYEHLRKFKSHAYNNIISKLFNLKNKDLINVELSNKNSVKIYELNGENFTIVVRGINSFRENNAPQRSCYSLIDSKNMSVMDGYKFYYGYFNINKNDIIHVFENDSFSADSKDNNSYRINRIMTTEEISDVSGYSEIQIINKKTSDGFKALYPDYLVIFDEIEEHHIIEAKRLNIPIVKINRTKYKEQSSEHSHMLYTSVEDGFRYIENEGNEKAWNKVNKRL